MNRKNQEIKIGGLKIHNLSIYIMIVASILIVCSLIATFFMSQKQYELVTSTNDYSALERQAESIEDASDYLTEQVRLFAQTSDLQYMNNYFEEVHNTRRREKALETFTSYQVSELWGTQLDQAVSDSMELMEREYYAMKLVSVANGFLDELLPEEIRNVELQLMDQGLAPDAMIERAQIMLFDQEYEHKKAVIDEHLSQFSQGVLLATKNTLDIRLEKLSRIIMMQRMLLCLLAVAILITYIAIRKLIVKPLRIQCKAIENMMPQPATGAYELQKLIQAYYRQLNLLNTARREQEQRKVSDMQVHSSQIVKKEDGNEQI